MDNICESVSLDQNLNILLKRYMPYNEDLNRVYMDVVNKQKEQ
ncbi:hypothetical protein P700755_003995 [Psychroflexus torquis ATCC 700755]|uniref:Uncharacterized protein n=1 Tax=Psychroflexus torquis (strain ATCC 700755 / CIP 106069 / ACAM 623) TaxID=313595 RepID=K4ING0_PSYTT|nr:hypothetical protein P700755_003995 [Psychroflexus torquis ATCC 700755]